MEEWAGSVFYSIENMKKLWSENNVCMYSGSYSKSIYVLIFDHTWSEGRCQIINSIHFTFLDALQLWLRYLGGSKRHYLQWHSLYPLDYNNLYRSRLSQLRLPDVQFQDPLLHVHILQLQLKPTIEVIHRRTTVRN